MANNPPNLQGLPTELFQIVASELPAEDFGSLRRIDRETRHRLTGHSLNVRIGPVKTIRNATSDVLGELLDDEWSDFRDRITGLQIHEDNIYDTLMGFVQQSRDEEGWFDDDIYDDLFVPYMGKWRDVLDAFKNLEVIIIRLTNLTTEDILDRDNNFQYNRAFEFLRQIVWRRKVTLHLASPAWDIIIFYEGTAESTSKVRIVGGHDTSTMLHLTKVNADTQWPLAVNLEDARANFCTRPKAVELYGFTFDDFNPRDFEEEEERWFDRFLIRCEKLVIKRCQLENFEEQLIRLVETPCNKTFIDIRNCTIDPGTCQTIINSAADPSITPHLTQFRLERIHNILFEWEPVFSPRQYDEGQSLQQYIRHEGFREAIRRMCNVFRHVQQGDNRTQFSTTWLACEDPNCQDGTAVQRMIRNAPANRDFYVNHRRG